MKAVFKGYKLGSGVRYGVHLTVGRVYDLTPCEEKDGLFEVVDDLCVTHVIRPNGIIYDFEVLTEDKPLSYDELFDDAAYGYYVAVNGTSNKPQIERKRFTYYINGGAVTKRRFDDVLLCVNDFKKDGIDTSSIKFEVKFE